MSIVLAFDKITTRSNLALSSDRASREQSSVEHSIQIFSHFSAYFGSSNDEFIRTPLYDINYVIS